MAQEKSLDRRKIKTKAAIRKAFISLIEEKGFEALLVSDIAERANINRGTFYLHYQDKFDLMDKVQTEIIENIQRIVVQANTLDLTTLNDLEKPIPIIVSIFEYLKENANLVHAIFSLEGGHPFQKRIKKILGRNLKLEFLTGLTEKNFIVPSNYLLSYAVSAHFGVIQDWLDRGCIETPGEMAVILSKISWFGVVRSAGLSKPGPTSIQDNT
jgi:AcrR family transcriptional regulator